MWQEGQGGGRVLLGPGFLGGWRRPAGLLDVLRLTHEDLAGTDLVGALRSLLAGVPHGGVLAGYLGYEAALAIPPLGELAGVLPRPASVDGAALPAAWAGAFARHEAAVPPPPGPVPTPSRLSGEGAGDPRARFEAAVAETRRAILDGALFQANLSRPLRARWDERPDAAALFGRLAAGTHAPYAALIEVAEGAVLSASPELFFAAEGDRVRAEPVKGTKPRGATPEADRALAAALLASDKDRAENVMIADLMRNDLSRVAVDGTVAEEAVCALRSAPGVHHLHSQISARLRPGLDALDVLAAAYPCGSITGAPKRAAMERIAQAEAEGRGPYCGAVFAVTPGGRAVFSVAIRTGALTWAGEGARLEVRTGGGVTALSDPAEEHEETVTKAYPFTLMTGLAP